MSLWTYILSLLRKHRKPPKPPTHLKAILHMSTATLTWVNPTTRTDNSPLSPSDIASVNVFDISTTDPSGPQIGTVLGGITTTFTTDTLTAGFHNFTVTVTDTNGLSSSASNVATVQVASTVANPSSPTDLTAVLNG